MSTWTDDLHAEARIWMTGGTDTANEEKGDEYLSAALDEIERLQAEADAPAPDPGVEFAEWVMRFVPIDHQDEAWREFTRSEVRICHGDHKTESQLREEVERLRGALEAALSAAD